MERNEAEEYLERKHEIDERKFTKEEEDKIQKVMKQGKIFGDPMCILTE